MQSFGRSNVVAPLITRGLGAVGGAMNFILRGFVPPPAVEEVVEIIRRGRRAAKDAYGRAHESARQIYIAAFLIEINREEVVHPRRAEMRRSFDPRRRILVAARLVGALRRAADSIHVAAAWISSRATKPIGPSVTAQRTRGPTPNRPTVNR